MIKKKTFTKILSVLVITTSIIATNVSAAGNEKNNQLTGVQRAQLEREIKELPLKELAIQEKIKNQKDGLIDNKLSATDSGIMTASFGTYPTRYGVILVTTDNTTFGINHGHAGIIWTSTTTVESLSNGVTRMPNTWNNYYNTVYGVTCSSTTASQDNDASNWCNAQVGKPYNYVFTDTSTRSRFYCSHLVWAAFKDKFGVNLDDDGGIIWPVDLVNTKNTYIIYTK